MYTQLLIVEANVPPAFCENSGHLAFCREVWNLAKHLGGRFKGLLKDHHVDLDFWKQPDCYLNEGLGVVEWVEGRHGPHPQQGAGVRHLGQRPGRTPLVPLLVLLRHGRRGSTLFPGEVNM